MVGMVGTVGMVGMAIPRNNVSLENVSTKHRRHRPKERGQRPWGLAGVVQVLKSLKSSWPRGQCSEEREVRWVQEPVFPGKSGIPSFVSPKRVPAHPNQPRGDGCQARANKKDLNADLNHAN